MSFVRRDLGSGPAYGLRYSGVGGVEGLNGGFVASSPILINLTFLIFCFA